MASTATAAGARPAVVRYSKAHLAPAGVYDAFGHELTRAHVIEHIRDLLGEPLIKLAAHAARHADDPSHPIHTDLQEAAHGRMAGTWHIARYDAPIEWFAEQYARSRGTQADVDATVGKAFHEMPLGVRIAADAALKRAHRAYHESEFADTFDNLFTTQGVSTLWNQAEGLGTTNSGAAVPSVRASYTNAQAVIGVGDSTTAAAAGQFDLQAATNRLWVAMDATFPAAVATGTNQIVFRSTFGSAQAVYAWQEFGVANDGGSNVAIPGSAARSASNGTLLDRVVSNQGKHCCPRLVD